ncbi:Solute carrier family 15 member 2 [Liparis tanakae]|uniref:Solute carrier family 15 member 2 n=1 Tax=Liparis tanakae TaxID=230148 RepID=A0A4Z2E376_9TELE|nr:Solute carrier family 15 member 2 [Liparis tanakae]
MATGMVFAALAFGAAALVELNVVSTVVAPPPVGACLLQVLNLAHGDVSLKLPGADAFQPIGYLQGTRPDPMGPKVKGLPWSLRLRTLTPDPSGLQVRTLTLDP